MASDGLPHYMQVGDFHTLLPTLLDSMPAREVAVLACHACTHLTDSLIATCIERGVDFAMMPCCQRDLHTQGQMAIVAKSLGIGEQAAIDVARMGGILARGYDCRWRTVDASITPQNRILIGLGQVKPAALQARQKVEDASNAKIAKIYKRIHADAPNAAADAAT